MRSGGSADVNYCDFCKADGHCILNCLAIPKSVWFCFFCLLTGHRKKDCHLILQEVPWEGYQEPDAVDPNKKRKRKKSGQTNANSNACRKATPGKAAKKAKAGQSSGKTSSIATSSGTGDHVAGNSLLDNYRSISGNGIATSSIPGASCSTKSAEVSAPVSTPIVADPPVPRPTISSTSIPSVAAEVTVKTEPGLSISAPSFDESVDLCGLCHLSRHRDVDCVLYHGNNKREALSGMESEDDGDVADRVKIIYFKNSDGKGDNFTSSVGVKMEPTETEDEESEGGESSGESSSQVALPELLRALRRRNTIRYTWVAHERIYLVSLTAGLNTTKVEKIDSKLTLTRFLRENGIRLYYVGKKCGHDAKTS